MTAFTASQIAALNAPLAREHVKERDQGRNKVSYIEGWHAIAEANRIFGFDGWTRETVMCECCYEGDYEKAVWENGHKTDRTVTSFRCSYRARVRVTAMGIVREGSGHGHGFADNPGEAHESAEKEAETDAMKRALMTFGNPFGLALYDKKQAEVAPANPSSAGANRATRPASTGGSRAPMAAAPQNSPTGHGPTATNGASHSKHPRREEALAAYRKIKKEFASAKLPRVIDDITAVHTGNFKLIKEVSPDAYEDLMSFATALKSEMLAAA